MKAFIETHKPAAVDLAKNFAYGFGAILGVAFLIAAFRLVAIKFMLPNTYAATVIVASAIDYIIFGTAFVAFGKGIRKLFGK